MKFVKRIILILAFGVIGFNLLPIFLAFCFQLVGYFSFETPDIPVIREGEFPFEVTYENNGEYITIKDVFVCKYEGIDITLGGKFRRWSGYFKNNGDKELTIFKDDTTEIRINIGAARYYMKDPNFAKIIGENKPSAYRIIKKDGSTYGESLSDEELYSEYGIKIISWELSKPIENTFVPKKWYEFWK